MPLLARADLPSNVRYLSFTVPLPSSSCSRLGCAEFITVLCCSVIDDPTSAAEKLGRRWALMATGPIAVGDQFVLSRSQLISWSAVSAQRKLLDALKPLGESSAHAEVVEVDDDDEWVDDKQEDDEDEYKKRPSTPKRKGKHSTQVASLLSLFPSCLLLTHTSPIRLQSLTPLSLLVVRHLLHRSALRTRVCHRVARVSHQL